MYFELVSFYVTVNPKFYSVPPSQVHKIRQLFCKLIVQYKYDNSNITE